MSYDRNMSKKKDMKVVKISRKRWSRGNGDGALRTESGQSCCLGFVARAYGLKTPAGSSVFSNLANNGQDCSVLPKKLQPIPSSCIADSYNDSALHDALTEMNDDSSETYRGSAREKEIAKLMAKAGIKAVFVD